MSQNGEYRNNPSKCQFNVGFCKYKEKCYKKHYAEKCMDLNCDNRCFKRHPKQCKRGQNCKFFKQKTCAYDHDPHVPNIDDDNLGDKIKEEIKKELENVKKISVDTSIKDLGDKISAEVKKQVHNLEKSTEKTFYDEIKDIKTKYDLLIKETKIESEKKVKRNQKHLNQNLARNLEDHRVEGNYPQTTSKN
jgi:hypothetical protein